MRLFKVILLVVIVALLCVGGWAYLRPLPPAKPGNLQNITLQSQAASLNWPSYGQGALGSAEYGFTEYYGAQQKAPTASVAKIVTALAVLQKHPLKSGEAGPNLTLDATDVGFYNNQYTVGGSVVKVANGESISLYQALQAMLLPSGNNMADSLARWAFGDSASYTAFANKMVARFGAKNTVIADASGISPDTQSTPANLVLLGQKLMANPVLAGIVAQQTASVPVAGTINNVNWLLGEDGVIGIKTGSTDQAGGNYLFATKRSINNKDTTLVGVIMGAPTRNQAIVDSRSLIKSIDSNFTTKQMLKNLQLAGDYRTAWGVNAKAVVSKGLALTTWNSQQPKYKIKLNTVKGGEKAGTTVGYVEVSVGNKTITRPVVLRDDIAPPSITWRLFR